ncbi:MAG: nucleotidyltransferase family protein [Porphyromonadaceae bacterium]|nr:MAG: nucleotidyltransferase family protein [Porphyromonadaceae bacterium]
MKALILAAGVGTRLKPLTDNTPKALIRIGHYSLLEIVIRRMAGAGIKSMVINVHHFPEQIIDFLRSNNNFGLDISISDESGERLDTGGAIKKASPIFLGEETVLVHNIDILSNLNFHNLASYHEGKNALVTLAVKDRPTSRSLLVDGSGRLCGWECPDKNLSILTRDNRKGLKTTAFSGVYVFSTKLLDKFPEETVFGFIPWILDLASSEKILTWDQSPAFWYEAGRPDSIALAARSLSFDVDDPAFIRENS